MTKSVRIVDDVLVVRNKVDIEEVRCALQSVFQLSKCEPVTVFLHIEFGGIVTRKTFIYHKHNLCLIC
jgi:hypothetical protein